MCEPDLTLLRRLLRDALREVQIVRTELNFERALLFDALHEFAVIEVWGSAPGTEVPGLEALERAFEMLVSEQRAAA